MHHLGDGPCRRDEVERGNRRTRRKVWIEVLHRERSFEETRGDLSTRRGNTGNCNGDREYKLGRVLKTWIQ